MPRRKDDRRIYLGEFVFLHEVKTKGHKGDFPVRRVYYENLEIAQEVFKKAHRFQPEIKRVTGWKLSDGRFLQGEINHISSPSSLTEGDW
jgi:hypothetical protein